MNIINNPKFLRGVVKPEDFPTIKYPEIAFIGRSNVGKSSIINNLLQNKNIARTSNTPGKTQEINFFSINDSWILVDMPGYGYASTSKSNRKKWQNLNLLYLLNREELKFTCVLVDSRHDPMQSDMELIELLEHSQKNYLIILTKCDKLSKTAIIDRKNQLKHIVSECSYCIDVLTYSVITSMGREELLGIIKKHIQFK